MDDLQQLALIYGVSHASWRGTAELSAAYRWQELRTDFLLGPLRQAIQVWCADIPSIADESDGQGAAVGGRVLVLRYFDRHEDQLATTLAVFLPAAGWLETDADGLYGVARQQGWQRQARRQVGRALGGAVLANSEDDDPFQLLGRSGHIHADVPPPAEGIAAASRLLHHARTLGEQDGDHWYRPDGRETAVLATAAGFVVFSAAARFSVRDAGDRPNQFERFLILHGLAYACRQALVGPSRWLAQEALPSGSHDTQVTEERYRTVRRLYDRQVQFEARYLFSNPVREAYPEAHGMARLVMENQGLERLREALNAQLDRLQGLAQHYLAEREAERRRREAQASARRQRWLNGIVTALGLLLAAGQTWFGWLAVPG